MSNRGLLSRIYNIKNSQIFKKTSSPIKKWVKDIKKFTKKDIQMADKHKKRGSTSLAIRGYAN